MSLAYTLEELARRLDVEAVGDGSIRLTGVRSLADAGPRDLSFLHNPKYVDDARASRAGAILVASAAELPGRALLVTPEPYLALARALALFHPPVRPPTGVHPTAVVSPEATLGADVSVGPHAVVEDGASIGDRTIVGAGCVVCRGATLGADCLLHPRVVVETGCRVGDRCILQAGAVIGSDGFGFATVGGVHHKVPQVGIVVLEDDVEIGANVTVDRAALEETRIGRGSKLDNLIQIAHNVRLGEGCLLAAQTGIAGSTTVGDHVMFGGQSGAIGHLEIASGALVAAKAAVYKSLPEATMYSGIPARPHGEWMRSHANLARFDRLKERIRKLEQRIAGLEGAGG